MSGENKNMGKLTVNKLKAMKPGTIFAMGEIVDNENGINMAGTGNLLHWVAARGGIHDWAIYCSLIDMDCEGVRRCGDKVTLESHIKKLVPCDDAAFKMYRH